MNTPHVLATMVHALLDKYGPVLTLPLPYALTPDAEQAQRLMAEMCPDLVVELEICGGQWRLVVSRKEATKRVPYDA